MNLCNTSIRLAGLTIVFFGFFIGGNVKADSLSSSVGEQLTWEEALKKAAQFHPDLVSAKEQIRQSKDSKLIIQSSFLPQVTGNLGVTQAKSPTTTTYSYGVSGSQLLFDAGKTINDVRSAKENVNASTQNFQYVSSLVRLRLRNAFINLLKAQHSVDLTREIQNIRKQNLDLITLRYNSGTEHRGALLTASANLAQSEFDIHQASRILHVAQRSLTKEIGSKKIEPISVVGDFDITNQYKETPNIDDLVSKHPQFLKIIAQKNAATFIVGADKADLWPLVSLNGGAGKSDREWPPSTTSTDVGLSLSWSIFQGGAKRAQLDRARSQVLDLQAQEQSLKDALSLTLEQDWADLEDAREQVQVQKLFLEAAEERAKIAEGQYKVGLITFDNWTIIQDDLVSSKKTFLNTQANALLAEANWVAAQGRTLEYEN